MDSLRISDADREAAVDRARASTTPPAGSTQDEFDERSDAVWSAKTRGDLAPIFADLPRRSPARPCDGHRPRRCGRDAPRRRRCAGACSCPY